MRHSFSLTDNGSSVPFFHRSGRLNFLPSGSFGGGEMVVEYDTAGPDDEPTFTNPGKLGETALVEPIGQVIEVANVWLRVTLSGATSPSAGGIFTKTGA